MNECERCSKAGYANFQNGIHCGVCGIGECDQHVDALGYNQTLRTHICRECTNNVMDEMRQYNWTTYP